MKYDHENDLYQCSLCTCISKWKGSVILHLKTAHKKEFKPKGKVRNISEYELTRKHDCETKICSKLYGANYSELWCEVCYTDLKASEQVKENSVPRQRNRNFSCSIGHKRQVFFQTIEKLNILYSHFVF